MFSRFKSVALFWVFVAITLISLALTASQCNPTSTPPPPGGSGGLAKGPDGPPTQPPEWQDLLVNQKNYDQIIQGTTEVINAGEEAEYYTEARLYRGLAELARGSDPQVAQADLDIAERFKDQLVTVDPTQEQALLSRSLMIIHTLQGQIEEAERYKAQAIELTPGQRSIIEVEFAQREFQP